MKTAILTIALFAATVLGTSSSSFAATGKAGETTTILTNVTSIDQIEVHGNVELYLSDGTADKVKVYNSYYDQNALVQDENGVLRISNYSSQKLVIWVTAKDISSLNVYDNATVKSFGVLSFIDLDVNLFDNALAQLNLDTYAAKVTLSNHAKADLSGSVKIASIRYDQSACLNTSSLAAEHITKTVNFWHHEHPRKMEFASL